MNQKNEKQQNDKMKIGTKSILFGAHAFYLHPFFVALGWWKLYGFPFDPRLWVAFFVHDLGYWGKPNMDGPEGESHPELGANIMGWLFDNRSNFEKCWNPDCYDGFVNHIEWTGEWDVTECKECYQNWKIANKWKLFTRNHSRFYAKKAKSEPSKLCAADKLGTYLTPWFIYLPMVIASGEIKEFMAIAGQGKYTQDPKTCSTLNREIQQLRAEGKLTAREWQRKMAESCRRSAMKLTEKPK